MFISKRENGIFYLFYKDNSGKTKKVSTNTKRKSEALEFLRQFEIQVHEKVKTSKNVLLQDFINEFLKYVNITLSPGSYELYRYSLNQFIEVVGNIPLGSITAYHGDCFKSALMAKIKPVTVNIRLTKMKAALQTAVRWELIQKNPLSSVSKLLEPQQLPSFITREEFRLLFSTIKEDWLKEIILFAVLTGLRRGEITSLRWSNVDFTKRVILIQSSPTFRSKQGKLRFVPMNDIVHQLLISRHGSGSNDEYVFTLYGKPILNDWVTHLFKRCVLRAGISNTTIHFHSLRHTFATWLVQEGISLFEVQKLLGHSNIVVTQIYSHLQTQELHSTVNRLRID